MDKREFTHQANRLLRIEPGIVDEQSGASMSATTGGRGYPRNEMPNLINTGLTPGDRVLIVGGGDGESPVVLGENPWITG